MGSWRDQILNEFIPQVARLTLVADPDSLLLEEGILKGIHERGFELIPFEDHVAFRYAYESKFRSRWDRGEGTELVVVLRSPSSDLDALPYDLLQAGRKLSFSLADLFPNLSYPVVSVLDRADLDALFDAQAQHAPSELGDNATKDFILLHVFKIVPQLIKEPQDLLGVLLRRHYRGERVPPILDERFVQLLRQNDTFKDWPLEDIVPDRAAFFGFLQERWPIFLDSLVEQAGARESAEGVYNILKFPGPALLPFDHDDVRVYIDDLFLEGLLRPIHYDNAAALIQTKPWVASGIVVSAQDNHRRRLEGLLRSAEKELPTAAARYGEWLRFAYKWAELTALENAPGVSVPGEIRERLGELRQQLDYTFTNWVVDHYDTMANLPPSPPLMLHHLPRYLARNITDSRNAKVAFLLVDGLALDQWVRLRQVLKEQNAGLHFREEAVFAWVPTITPVSRQAAFAGQPPAYFPTSINTTDKEEGLWERFWVNQGLSANEVAYARGLGDVEDLKKIEELLSLPKLRVVGLVVDKVDRIMHGMMLGTAGMHNQVEQWAQLGFMRDLIGLLQARGFQVYLASDHGNIEARGVGQPREGAVAEMRGERVRIYPDPSLRAQVAERFPGSLEWQSDWLPEKYYALIAPTRAAFVQKGKVVVGHGGISIEELIVPFVKVEQEKH